MDAGQTLDKLERQNRTKIDIELSQDGETAKYRGGSPFKVGGQKAEMLRCIVKNDPDPTYLASLHNVVGIANWHNVRKRLKVVLEPQSVILHYVPGKGVCLIENAGENPPSEESVTGIEIPDGRPLFTNSAGRDTGHGFAISIDGIILNSASELIYGRIDTDQVEDCPLLYRSSIEDLAFALVYGSRISSKWRPHHKVASELGVDAAALTYEPAGILISHLEDGLYDTDIENEKFRYGRILDNEQDRTQIGQYIESLGKAMEMPVVREMCREWLVREAATYLGEHSSVFEVFKNGDRLRFGKEYYDSPLRGEIPGLVGEGNLKTLVSFLPKMPLGTKEQYSPLALREFVLRNVLTHITIMYEYERAAEAGNTHRLPFMLRCAVKEHWHKEHEAEDQLRTMLVRSALYEGLRESADAYGREQLVKRLLWVRKEPNFVSMRSRLDELSAMVKEHRSKGMEKLLDELRSNAPQRHETIDKIGISRNVVLPHLMFKRVDAREYMLALERAFPELAAQNLRSTRKQSF
jgi:hypothetical protein